MRQMHCKCTDMQAFESFAKSISDKLEESPQTKALVHLFNDTAQRDVTAQAESVLRAVVPNVPYIGCSTSGNICDGSMVRDSFPNLTAICTIFEDADTNVEVHQYPLTRDSFMDTAESLIKLVRERPWVKAVEIITTLIDVGMVDFCDRLNALREGVIVFGGAALSTENINMWTGLPYVLSSAGENSGSSIAAVLYGGNNLHVHTQTVFGWKPLGRHLEITRSIGPKLCELDGVPASELFKQYLALEDDELISQTGFIFPFAVERDGRIVIKAPVTAADDGSIVLTSDLSPYHKKCRIAYGDPGTILRSIKKSAEDMQQFEPQGIMAYSCAARRMYWDDDNISRETLPFQSVAPTSGFYTGGEFCREGDMLLHHNVTLVVAGLREGDIIGSPKDEIEIKGSEFTRQMSIVNSLAAFVGVTSAELEAAYAKLEVMARTDGLTGVLNRREIDSRIIDALGDFEIGAKAMSPSLIMLDLDDFKVVNDTYGHKAGDDVLKGFGSLLKKMVDYAGKGYSGRWGGEEFMILVPNASFDKARALAEEIRSAFADTEFPTSGKHTVSVGVAQALPSETSDQLCQRVDKALYAAKKQGKNCVVVA